MEAFLPFSCPTPSSPIHSWLGREFSVRRRYPKVSEDGSFSGRGLDWFDSPRTILWMRSLLFTLLMEQLWSQMMVNL